MANFDFINLLARHVAVNYLKLKSNTSTVQRTASSIGFICKSLISCSTSSASDVYFISFLQFRTSHQRCSIKSCSCKFHKIHRKTPVPEPRF